MLEHFVDALRLKELTRGLLSVVDFPGLAMVLTQAQGNIAELTTVNSDSGPDD